MQEQDLNVKFSVKGMTCGGCVRAVENAIREVPGVREVKVDLAGEEAQVQGNGFSTARVVEVVEDAGFEARAV